MVAISSNSEAQENLVLIRSDADSQTYTLPEGATLGDLLREAGVAIRSPNLLIDGRPIEDAMTLESGMTVTINSEDNSKLSNGSWRATVGKFSNPAILREIVAEGRAIREAEREAARNQPE